MRGIEKTIVFGIACSVILSSIMIADSTRGEMWLPQESVDNTYDLKYVNGETGFPQDPDQRIVESVGNIGLFTSLAIEGSEPRISYYDETNGNLKFAYATGNDWSADTVDSDGNVGLYTSLVLDGNVPHISYYDATERKLMYVTKTGDPLVWASPEEVDGVGGFYVGQYSSIALDTGGNLHISYYDVTRETLKYATGTSSAWTIEDVFPSGSNDVGQYSSIGVDSSGIPRISYYDATSDLLYYAVRDGPPAMRWRAERVDWSGHDVGQYSSLAMDSGGVAHISYYDVTSEKLRYVSGTYGSWAAPEYPDSTTGVGKYASIDVESIAGIPHVSYFDETNGNLKRAVKSGGNWVITVVEDLSEDFAGHHTSIALDGTTPYISYSASSWRVSGPSDPAVATADCIDSDCVYRHVVWKEFEIFGGDYYQMIYYRRSSDGGRTWDLDSEALSSRIKHPMPKSSLECSAPSISVVGGHIHVVWTGIHELVPIGPSSELPSYRTHYRLSKTNGQDWLDEVLIDETDYKDGRFGSVDVNSEQPTSVYATNSYVHVVWIAGAGDLLHKSASVSEAHDISGWNHRLGQHGSLAVSRSRETFISYYDDTQKALRFSGSDGPAEYYTDIRSQVVDGIGDNSEFVGRFTSLALDDKTRPTAHISYYQKIDANNGALMYAHWNMEDWDTKQVEHIPGAHVGFGTSIAVTSDDNPALDGKPRIAYYDLTNKVLRYAYSDNGIDWNTEQIPCGSSDCGKAPSLKLDSDNLAHIVYYDVTNEKLMFVEEDALGGWKFLVTIDGTGNVGSDNSLVLDANNVAHVSYYDQTNRDLLYTREKAVPGTFESPATQIDTGSHANDNVGLYSSIDVDSKNCPRIGYYALVVNNLPVKDLKYAYQSPTSGDCVFDDGWTDKTVVGTNDVGEYASIGLDFKDWVYISYYDATEEVLKVAEMDWYHNFAGTREVYTEELLSSPFWSRVRNTVHTATSPSINGWGDDTHVVFSEYVERGDLKYAYYDGSNWQISDPPIDGDNGDDVGRYTSIAIDTTAYEQPHISYYDDSNTQLKYAWLDKSLPTPTWVIEVVDDEFQVGKWSSLALDVNNVPHISYYDMAHYELRYATKDGLGNWQTEKVPHGGASWERYGSMSSIAVDGSNKPSISYWTDAVKVWFAKDPPSWPTDLVDGSKGYTSLALETRNSDLPHITYMKGDYELWHAYDDGGWTPEWVYGVSNDYVNNYNSLALYYDSTPAKYYPRVTFYYCILGNCELRMRYKDDSGWRGPLTVDNSFHVGLWNSLALESGGDTDVAHFSYYDETNGNLKYAKQQSAGSGSFDKEPVDGMDGSDVGLYTSIALDSSNHPHISYYDRTGDYGIKHRRGSIDGKEAWTDKTLISDEPPEGRARYPDVTVSEDNVHVVWSDWRDKEITGKEIYYERSTDRGDNWLGSDVRISTGTPDPSWHDLEPKTAVSGVTVEIVWEHSKTDLDIGNIRSSVYHAINRINGESSSWEVGWIAPNPVPLPWVKYEATDPDISATGNDRYVTYVYELDDGAAELSFVYRIDDVSPLTWPSEMIKKKGASSVWAYSPIMEKDMIFVVGGESLTGLSDEVIMIDPYTGSKSLYCNFRWGLKYTSAIWPGGNYIYVFGGQTFEGGIFGVTDRIMEIVLNEYNPTQRCYVTNRRLDNEKYGTSSVYDGSQYAYIFGGTDGTRYYGEILRWDMTWPNPLIYNPEYHSDLPNWRAFTSAIWEDVHQKAYIFGGEDDTGQPIDKIAEFTPGQPALDLINSVLKTPRSKTAAVFDGTYAYVLGGESSTGSGLPEILRFNANEDWTMGVNVMCMQLLFGLKELTAVVSSDTRRDIDGTGIFIVGGESSIHGINDEMRRYWPSYWLP